MPICALWAMAELDEWKLRDPLRVAREGLAARYGVAEPALHQVEQEVSAQLAEMRERGLAAPYPAAEDNLVATEFKAA